MRLHWTGLRRPQVPDDVAAVIPLAAGEKLLAWATGEQGLTVVAGRHRLYVVTAAPGSDPTLVLDRPWHLVDAGTWSEEGVLRVVWVDGRPPLRVVLTEPGMLPETLRERVQASVVLAETLDLGGRRTAKVVVRRDLATRRLLSQAVLGTGVRSSDPGVDEQVRAGLARVREQVGLD
ncbi:hypothetical protein [uncultured Phycicoccus sp.]|uniref:hypothetical protein n=1 Tax=uncultured Phycicoccus sp. TaxID=661422 RepID=UPI002617232E|nr:hypothetical protein [uncultured Phycicoccus sp.]